MSFKKYLEYGHVKDELLEQLGFPMDRDVDGTAVCLQVHVLLLCIIVLYKEKALFIVQPTNEYDRILY